MTRTGRRQASRAAPRASPAGRARPRPGSARTASRRGPPRSRRRARFRDSSRRAAPLAARRAVPPGTAAPTRATRRCRTVDPGGPAGSSRSIVPSSAATSAAYAVRSFVTDAQRKTRSVSPCVASETARGDGRDGRVLHRPALDLTQSLHGAILGAWNASASRPAGRTSRSSATAARCESATTST